MNSVWSEITDLPQFPKFNGKENTDVLIIGGGLAGILCAYFLNQSGIDYILVESRNICSGITKNTTAKITAQHGLIYSNMIKSIGNEGAKMYLDANLYALKQYQSICKSFDCDYEEKPSYVYSLDKRQKIQDEVLALQKIGYQAEFTNTIELPFDIAGAVIFPKQAQFNPLKFAAFIAKDLNIYENSHVREMTEHKAILNNGIITAKKIIVATHFPFINKHGSYFIKQYQHRSYVIALENASNINGMYVDEAEKGMSFRSYENLLLIGGGDHRTGKKGGNWKELEEFTKKHYPKSQVKFKWATQDCMTLDNIAYIGQYSKNTPDFYVSSGFNKWGITSSMVSAMILSDLVAGKENPYAEVFSPSRSIIKPQLFINIFEAVKNFVIPSVKRCPHLGCVLKWNDTEHSWDCPCHGSRFDANGIVLDNPSNGNLK